MDQEQDFERQTEERFQKLLRSARKKAAEDAAQLELQIRELVAKLAEVSAGATREAAQLEAFGHDRLRELDREARRVEQRVLTVLSELDRRIGVAIGVAEALEMRASQIEARQARTAGDLDKIESIRTSDRRMMTDADIMELRRRSGTS